MEVKRKDETIAFMWWNYAGTLSIIEAHACAKPGKEGRWLTPHVFDRGWQVMLASGADYCIAQLNSPLTARIWERLGATLYDRIMVLPLKE